ncbi:MAG: Nif3-like dinuclear metal center hexameric protein [Clostridiales bacterium]|jgi:putative NIF3 family GTP cyclohydrolase 1 type 2|nr:Nif3-like dinuclear metal center hexameric protein [Clostridiales bacterium]
MTVKQVIEKIIGRAGLPMRLENTCDVLVCGSSDMEVRGIVTSFMATAEVIRKAAEIGANMIITHEPTWFSAADDTGWLAADPVYLAKKALLEKTGIAVWRYHDHMHMRKPDEIYEGITAQLGWERYAWRADGRRSPAEPPEVQAPADFAESFRDYYDLPETTVRELAEDIKTKLEMSTVRIVGNPDMPCSRVGILVGGGSLGLGGEKTPARTMEKHGIHVMICGDVVEWTLPAYINDAAQLGLQRALIIAGHERTEEWGMKHMTGWLTELTSEGPAPGVPVAFISAKEPYCYPMSTG